MRRVCSLRQRVCHDLRVSASGTRAGWWGHVCSRGRHSRTATSQTPRRRSSHVRGDGLAGRARGHGSLPTARRNQQTRRDDQDDAERGATNQARFHVIQLLRVSSSPRTAHHWEVTARKRTAASFAKEKGVSKEVCRHDRRGLSGICAERGCPPRFSRLEPECSRYSWCHIGTGFSGIAATLVPAQRCAWSGG